MANTLHRIDDSAVSAARRPGLAALACLIAAGCGGAERPAADPADTGTAAPARATATGACLPGGYLEAAFYGTLSATIDWRDGRVDCEGMQRPEGAGARLRFAGSLGDSAQRVALIVAVPGLVRGEPGEELPVNVTLIEEGRGRFFSTSDLDTCWADIAEQRPLADADDAYAIAGSVYCIAPLAAVNDSGSVSIERLAFAGRVDWKTE